MTSQVAEPKAGLTELQLDGHGLGIDDVVRVARRDAAIQLGLDPAAVHRMAASNQVKRKMLSTGVPIYGVTTGFGDSASRQISVRKTAALQRNLITYHLTGRGPMATAEVVRATMLIRANCLARGNSGVRPELVELLLTLLNHDVLPQIPERGSVGASGDLVPLCHLSALLLGEGTVQYQGRVSAAADALADCGLTAIELESKEGLALINGTPFMSAFAALAVRGAAELAFAADLCTALASQVLLGNPAHFEPFVHAQKPHLGQEDSARIVRQLLAGSGLAYTAPEPNHAADGTEPGLRELPRPIQDRYSIRCAPHVTGVLRDTLRWVEEWVTVEINSSNDNPLFDPDEGVVHSGGNFYGGHIAQAMDALTLAVASVGDLLDRQLELVVDEKFNNGLTPNLIPRFSPDDWEAGLHHGFKGMQLTASALVAEALKLTNPASAYSRSTEAHNQDKVSLGSIAARNTRDAVDLVTHTTAIHLLALCQAADLRGPDRLSPTTLAAYHRVRAEIPFVDRDRRMDDDIDRAAELIRTGALRAVCAPALT